MIRSWSLSRTGCGSQVAFPTTSHTLELWLNLPAAAKMVESAYQDLLADRPLRVSEAGADIRLLSGTVSWVELS